MHLFFFFGFAHMVCGFELHTVRPTHFWFMHSMWLKELVLKFETNYAEEYSTHSGVPCSHSINNVPYGYITFSVVNCFCIVSFERKIFYHLGR